MKITNLKIKDIRPNPRQPREGFSKDKIKELAQSIKEGELLQPIVVRKSDGNYQIIAGERRWRALSLLEKKEVPAIVWDIKDDIEALEKSAIENIQREDLTSVERENIISDLWESGRYKTKYELAKKLGYSHSTEGGSQVHTLLRTKEDRKRLGASPGLASMTIKRTEGLPDEERKKIIKKVEKGELDTSLIEDYVSFKKTQPSERRFKGKPEITPESKEKYIHGKLVQSLSSIVMLSIGWTPERVRLINKYSTPKERKEIVRAVEDTVKKWTKILEALKK